MNLALLSVVFQPIVNLLDGTVLGYEALGRMKGREHEGFGPVRDWMQANRSSSEVWRALLRLAFDAGSERPEGTLLFVNVRLDDLEAVVAADIDWSDIVLEVPESDRRVDQWDARLAGLRALGAGVAIDDWGVGTADPLRLIQLGPDWLKIDRALTMRLGEPDVDRLVELLVRWVRPETRIIAEGIEELEQIYHLRQLGVRLGQGFALARPGPLGAQHVAVPNLSSRVGGLRRTAMALAEANGLTDRVLTAVEEGGMILAPVLADGVVQLADWIAETMMRSRLMAVDRGHYIAALTRHFLELTRGRLGEEHVKRAEQIVRVHQQYGVDLSYYLSGYQRLQAYVARRLRGDDEHRLADAMRALFNWDQGMVVQAYQQRVDWDSLTGVLTRQAFRDRVARDIRESGQAQRRFVFGLLDVEGLREMHRRYGHTVSDRVMARVGQILRDLMAGSYVVGRTGGDQFGLWVPYRRGTSARRELSRVLELLVVTEPELTFDVGFAILGRDGWTADALYERADRRLFRGQRVVPANS